MSMNLMAILFYCVLSSMVTGLPCSHDLFSLEHPKIFLHDLTESRLLQAPQTGRLRIMVDYSQLTTGTVTEINTIKRVMNITASYFYNVLNVTRLPLLYFPPNRTLECSLLKVPEQYVKGTIGDLGILCGNQQRTDAVYIAKSVSCVHLESNKRPIWGMIMFNNNYLKFDQEGFQQILFVGMHEMTHILGFSASMYEMYPKGNPLVQDSNGGYYLNSTDIQREIRSHFGCNNSKGLPLEDQDGTLIASHWERKVVGNQYMIATNKKNSLVSLFTLALFNSTGWYTSVNTTLSQPLIWGKGKGCSMLDIDNCQSSQFCTTRGAFLCDLDGTGIGKCDVDAFAGSCMLPKYFVNTICVDENFQTKNLNAALNGLERGGSSSRCFDSDFRSAGVNKTTLNNRCYVAMCSATGKSLFVLFGTYVLVCSKEGQTVSAPAGFDGTLTCPKSFAAYCGGKKTCSYHCNKNGACINGKCLCTGTTYLSNGCADVSIFTAPIGNSGVLVNAYKDLTNQLTLDLLLNPLKPPTIPNLSTILPQYSQRQQIKKYSINSKCIQGTTYDKIFGECLQCSEVFNCNDCDDGGCISCDDGRPPTFGVCLG